jgi:hypothetical protein
MQITKRAYIMSNISNRHSVSLFTAGKSVPLNGQRLAKVGYKSTKNNPAKFKSICVSVPYTDVQEIRDSIDSLLPHIGTLLENAQDGIIRSLYESSEGQLQSVSDAEISVAACIAFLNAEASGNRLSSESIGIWFDTQVAENLTVVIADKLGFTELTDAAMETVNKHLKSYRQLFAGLAGKNLSYTPVQISGLERAMEVASVDDDMSGKLVQKLNTLKAPKPSMEELLDL